MAKLFPWDPWLELESMKEDMKRMVDECACPSPFARNMRNVAQFRPVADVVETDDGFIILIELPGMRREEISLEVHGNELAVFGERKLPVEQQGINFQVMERSYGCFARRFILPVEVDPAGVDAVMKDGLLRVSIPKLPAQPKRRSIQVVADD